MHKELLLGDDVFLIHGFLTSEECAEAIAKTEQQGYKDAPITMGAGTIMLKDYRDNTRVMVDDIPLAAELYERAKPFLPERIEKRTLCGLNERLRYYRYDVGQKFSPHYDGSFWRNVKEESQLTFMVYLNEGCVGGTTDFYNRDNSVRLKVQPKTGMALVFKHELLHGGAEVVEGRKYVLRTDVMYALNIGRQSNN